MSLKVLIKSHNSLPAHNDAFPISMLIMEEYAFKPSVNDILVLFLLLKNKEKNPASSEAMSGIVFICVSWQQF